MFTGMEWDMDWFFPRVAQLIGPLKSKKHRSEWKREKTAPGKKAGHRHRSPL